MSEFFQEENIIIHLGEAKDIDLTIELKPDFVGPYDTLIANIFVIIDRGVWPYPRRGRTENLINQHQGTESVYPSP